jgi:hypothetical protein
MPSKPESTSTDIMAESFLRETTDKERGKNTKALKEDQRSLVNAPVDPNSATTRIDIPPGIQPEDVADPGRATPGAPAVEDRSGKGRAAK